MLFLVGVAFLFSLYLCVKTLAAVDEALPLLFPWVTGQVMLDREVLEEEFDLELLESLIEETKAMKVILDEFRADMKFVRDDFKGKP